MSNPTRKNPEAKPDALFDRIVTILEQARGNVVWAVNTNMVTAYWLIGREIVEEIQRGKGRAKYGEKVIEYLSARLTERYGQGFSPTTLQYFRKFYLAYPERCSAIPRPMGAELGLPPNPNQPDTKLTSAKKSYPAGTEFPQSFSPQLSWSHYRALMRVENREARDFYEREAIVGGWDKRTLERQIQSYYYERMFDGLFVAPDDNPSIGLILCTEKNETVARYSVLNDRKQIFASKYMLYLPTEEQLRLEIEKERRLIEAAAEDKHQKLVHAEAYKTAEKHLRKSASSADKNVRRKH